MTLAELRIALANAKDELRKAKTDLETAKTIATMYTKGTNAEERKKADAQALLDDGNYNRAVDYLNNREYEVDRISAEIEIIRDARTARELDIRERNNEVLDKYADALLRVARAAATPAHVAIDQSVPF